jgi:hypothetical protein
MAHKRANPAAGDDRARDMISAANNPENSNPNHRLQELRARFIARRFSVPPDVAILLATLALGVRA